ncbi:hypothetical protein SprV_0802555600 [Sparganum proliferum]
MSQIPRRQQPPRERRSAIDEALYLLEGEAISSPEPQEDADDSFETIPLGDDTPTRMPRVNSQENILLLMCKHMREQSMKLDILVETVRKLLGRQRLLESMIQQQAKSGQIVDEFVKRIFFAVFDDEISLHVNFKDRKTEESLSGSKLYAVILVFGAWNTDASVKLSDLESALTKRLKRSLDTCFQRKNKLQVNQDDNNIPGPSTDSPAA